MTTNYLILPNAHIFWENNGTCAHSHVDMTRTPHTELFLISPSKTRPNVATTWFILRSPRLGISRSTPQEHSTERTFLTGKTERAQGMCKDLDTNEAFLCVTI